MIEQLPATALHEWLADDKRATPLIVQQIPARIDELPRDRDIVVVCHHGMRSWQVAEFLAGAGFTRLYNLSGGMAAWSAEVDPQTPQY